MLAQGEEDFVFASLGLLCAYIQSLRQQEGQHQFPKGKVRAGKWLRKNLGF